MTRWDREVAAELVGRHGCTEWINITTMVVDLLSSPRIGEYDLGTLSYIGGGGAPLPAAVGEKLEELTGTRYVEGYGLTRRWPRRTRTRPTGRSSSASGCRCSTWTPGS
jgi:fatty-acyl-CoA synthase